jgi:hypothetical protein
MLQHTKCERQHLALDTLWTRSLPCLPARTEQPRGTRRASTTTIRQAAHQLHRPRYLLTAYPSVTFCSKAKTPVFLPVLSHLFTAVSTRCTCKHLNTAERRLVNCAFNQPHHSLLYAENRGRGLSQALSSSFYSIRSTGPGNRVYRRWKKNFLTLTTARSLPRITSPVSIPSL